MPCMSQVAELGRQVFVTFGRHLGALFMAIFAVKYRHLIQTGNVNFSHSLSRAREDATAAKGVQTKNCGM